MAGHLKLCAFALALGVSASTFAAVTIHETFDTDPSARGWGGSGNQTPPNNYGFSNTDNTGSAVNPPGGTATGAGEIGGSINRGPNTFYGVDLGGAIDFKTTDMNIKGVMHLTNRGSSTTLSVGWGTGLSTVTGPGNGETGAFVGMRWDDGWNGSGGLQARGNGFGIQGTTGPSFVDPNTVTPPATTVPVPFEMDWKFGIKTLTMTLGGNSNSLVISDGNFPDMPTLTHWQMFGRTNASPDNANTLWVDDLTFTAASAIVPEPASFGLLSIAAAAAFCRRRRS
jgi:hypothetical protein